MGKYRLRFGYTVGVAPTTQIAIDSFAMNTELSFLLLFYSSCNKHTKSVTVTNQVKQLMKPFVNFRRKSSGNFALTNPKMYTPYSKPSSQF